MRRLHAAVLALYPVAVRRRYGREIVDLLERSDSPGRDLANVAWAALGERASAATTAVPRLARRTPRRLVVAAVTALACVAVAVLGLSRTVPPMSIVVVAVVAGLVCPRQDNRLRTAAAVTGTILILFTAAHAALLLVGDWNRIPEVVGTATLSLGLFGLACLVRTLARRARRRTVLPVAILGAATLPQLATALMVALSGTGTATTPWLAYWMTMLPYRASAHTEDVGWLLDDLLIWYPALFTFCAWFVAAYVLRVSHQPRILTQAPVAPGHG
jgi:hypothetical protein